MPGFAALIPPTLVLFLAPTGDPPEWGGFRGNHGSGMAPAGRIPDALDPEANLAWRIDMPAGYSSPVIAGDNVFLTGFEGTKLVTVCVARSLGEERWRREVDFDGSRPGANSPASPTPVTDGERLFVVFHGVGLIAYDVEGEELWRKEMEFNIPHGMSTSPLLHDDLVVLLVDQDVDAYLVALDQATGKERWRAERPGVAHTYSTPTIHTPESGPAQVIVSGSFQICAYSAVDGEKLWWVDGAAWQSKSVPVVSDGICFVNSYMKGLGELGMPRFDRPWKEALAEHDADGDGRISRDEWQNDVLHQGWFILDLDGDDRLDERDYEYGASTNRSTGGLFAIRLGGKGDVTGSHLVWKYDDRRGLPDVTSPLVVGDTLFVIKRGGILTAFDPATGEVAKRGRVGEPDAYFASPIAAGGRIVTASQSGQLAVIDGGREWEVVSVTDLDEEIWSTPAIAGDQVLVRTQAALYCFGDS